MYDRIMVQPHTGVRMDFAQGPSLPNQVSGMGLSMGAPATWDEPIMLAMFA